MSKNSKAYSIDRAKITGAYSRVGSGGYSDIRGLEVATDNPTLSITMSKSSYTTGETITATEFRIRNPSAQPVPSALRVWLRVPTIGEIDLVNIGSDGSFSLPGNVDANLGPLSPITITSTFPPRGNWEFNSRIKDPATGAVLSEDLNPFTISN